MCGLDERIQFNAGKRENLVLIRFYACGRTVRPVVSDSGETDKIAFYSSLATLRDNADRRQEGGIVLAVSRNYVRSLAVLLGRFSSIVSNKRSNKKLYFPVLHDVFGRFKDQQTLGKGGFCQSPAAVWGATLRVVPSQQCPVFLVTAGEEKAVIVKKGCESRRSCHLARHGSSAFSIGTRLRNA